MRRALLDHVHPNAAARRLPDRLMERFFQIAMVGTRRVALHGRFDCRMIFRREPSREMLRIIREDAHAASADVQQVVRTFGAVGNALGNRASYEKNP